MGKIKRQRHVKKTMLFYKQHFGYEPPYTVLIDGTFCKEALNFKINIIEQLPRYLDAEVNLATTSCVKAECEMFGATPDLPLYAPLKIISQYRIHECPHTNTEAICPSHCLLSMARKRKFFIATQEKNLSDRIRETKGVPLLYIAYQAIHLEPPSAKTISFTEQKLKDKTKLSDFQKTTINGMKKSTFGELEVKKKRKKKKKGVNPLSCLKKKKNIQENDGKNKNKMDNNKNINNNENIDNKCKNNMVNNKNIVDNNNNSSKKEKRKNENHAKIEKKKKVELN